MEKSPLPNQPEVENRRLQLRRWIDERFGGNQAAYIASTNDGERQLNQGELSGLLKNKSFGEKRAKSLEALSGMPAGYLNSTMSPKEEQPGAVRVVAEPQSRGSVTPLPQIKWPFKNVSYQRIMDLRKALGQIGGQEAIRDIDALLDVAVTRWERVAEGKKRASR